MSDQADRGVALPSVEAIASVPLEELPRMLAHLAALQAALAARLAIPGGRCPPPRQEGAGDRLVPIREAAARAGMSVDWFYRHAGSLPFSRRIGRKWLFSERGLMRWLAARGA